MEVLDWCRIDNFPTGNVFNSLQECSLIYYEPPSIGFRATVSYVLRSSVV